MVELYCQKTPWSKTIEFVVVHYGDGTRSVGTNVTMQEIGDGVIQQPTFSMGQKECQSLMDQLWQCGFRPSEGSGSAGSLAATQRHLEDMQKIATGVLRKIGVQV